MQARVSSSINFFKNILFNKFNFEEYSDLNKPTIFFGIYRNSDYQFAANHKGKKIIWFTGTDANSHVKLKKIKNDYRFKDALFIAESKWIENDLDKIGIKYKSISIIFDDIYNWNPEPLGDSLFWYSGRNSKYYGKKYIEEIKERIPDLSIITLNKNNIEHNEMVDTYKKCFAGIRTIEHDGMSQTVAEMGLMGRKTIWNGNGPMAMSYNNIDDIVNIIKSFQKKGYNQDLIAKRTRNYFIENEAKLYNIVLNFFGIDEMDFMNVFDNAGGKCGSIFRIQRTKDIKRIGGLGHDQYERPWFRKKMEQINKKQLLISKYSGYMAGEWKNIDHNKGYPKGFKKFKTHDRGTN